MPHPIIPWNAHQSFGSGFVDDAYRAARDDFIENFVGPFRFCDWYVSERVKYFSQFLPEEEKALFAEFIDEVEAYGG
jgi:hypothetical protein